MMITSSSLSTATKGIQFGHWPSTTREFVTDTWLISTSGAEEFRMPLPGSVEVSPGLPAGLEAGGLQSVV
jgi:hypothetical protein